MPGIVQGTELDPVPEWRLKVWEACGPKHRMLACDREGKYHTVFDTHDKREALRWWERVKARNGTDWKDWTWLAYYATKDGRYGIVRLMLFPRG